MVHCSIQFNPVLNFSSSQIATEPKYHHCCFQYCTICIVHTENLIIWQQIMRPINFNRWAGKLTVKRKLFPHSAFGPKIIWARDNFLSNDIAFVLIKMGNGSLLRFRQRSREYLSFRARCRFCNQMSIIHVNHWDHIWYENYKKRYILWQNDLDHIVVYFQFDMYMSLNNILNVEANLTLHLLISQYPD